ncbi:MAG TPA: sigma-70 family RNA polymerase sigma factor [Kribbella sp.]|uniref:sigma-70 family RNA polymerase sigma factor n=1 Tax=Kribbella sp. TaxID=1871183 RepID=UPI002D7725F4|nr:sigma-70 family RNA polymerase sigma factor [Kribbella sp.]HET6299220.1 sigma-70 family RNA polymerase sigma factor [Kribbella sp.]
MARTAPVRTADSGLKDTVGQYLQEIARTSLLTATDEAELAATIEVGLFAEQRLVEGQFGGPPESATQEELEWLAEEGRRAHQRFVTANLRLVVSIARRYGRSQLPLLDLIQEGNAGLIRAVEKFDYRKGFKFSTYATWWIRQAITRAIAQQSRVVKLPVHVVEQLSQIGTARRTLERELGREPEIDEIAAELDLDEERITDLMRLGRDHLSLDSPIDEAGETSLGDLIAAETTPGPDQLVANASVRSALFSLVDELDPRSADVIRRRYGLHDGLRAKLAEIGAVHGISPERVRQIEREALAWMRSLADPALIA